MNKEFEENKLNFITKSTDSKIADNENIIKYNYYQLRIQYDLSEEQIREFVRLAKIRLNNLNYNTYTKGQRYRYNYKENEVKSNEELVAVKQKHK